METKKFDAQEKLDFTNPEIKFFSDVYDILVKLAGARSDENNFEKHNFITSHLSTTQYRCHEWRFCGLLGFGGKYWSGRNQVDCYKENRGSKEKRIIEKTNAELAKLTIPVTLKPTFHTF
jgi:hypothetical protein